MKNKEQKREEAKERRKIRNNRSPQEQLRLLDKKYGKGLGSRKERLRLSEKIKKNKK